MVGSLTQTQKALNESTSEWIFGPQNETQRDPWYWWYYFTIDDWTEI